MQSACTASTYRQGMSTDPLQAVTNEYMTYRLAARALVAEVDTWCVIQRSNPWRHRQEYAVAGIVKRATDRLNQLEAMYDADADTVEKMREQVRMFVTVAATVIREAAIVPELQADLRDLLRSPEFRQSINRAAEEYTL